MTQLTIHSWVLPGRSRFLQVSVFHDQTQDTLSRQLKRFWEVEEAGSPPIPTLEKVWAEVHFQTHIRDSTGRYVVRLPCWPSGGLTLGNSRPTALRLLLSSERRCSRHPDLQMKYADFMAEYIALGHGAGSEQGDTPLAHLLFAALCSF